jgi:ATP-dependent Clp protease protease subunit
MAAASSTTERMIMARKRPWFRIENAAKAEEATVYIYEEIDSFWGVSAQDFVRELNQIKASTIHVRINSPGGNYFDGMAIYNALRKHPAEIVTHVDGLAASSASSIAMAGDRIVMGGGSFLMIHNAWGIAIGDGDELRKTADVLDKVTGSIVDVFAKHTGKSVAQIEEMMDAETWLTADEAVAEGFAHETEEVQKVSASFDLSKFRNTPRSLLEETRDERPAAPPATVREFEEFLRDGGFSISAAKTIAAEGYKGASPPRDEAPDNAVVDEILAQLVLTRAGLSMTR